MVTMAMNNNKYTKLSCRSKLTHAHHPENLPYFTRLIYDTSEISKHSSKLQLEKLPNNIKRECGDLKRVVIVTHYTNVCM